MSSKWNPERQPVWDQTWWSNTHEALLLGALTGGDHGTVTFKPVGVRAARALERNGLVTLEPIPPSGKNLRVRLTPLGEVVAGKVRTRANHIEG